MNLDPAAQQLHPTSLILGINYSPFKANMLLALASNSNRIHRYIIGASGDKTTCDLGLHQTRSVGGIAAHTIWL